MYSTVYFGKFEAAGIAFHSSCSLGSHSKKPRRQSLSSSAMQDTGSIDDRLTRDCPTPTLAFLNLDRTSRLIEGLVEV